MRVLVLGASGMVGSMVATYLKETGFEVSTIAQVRKLNEETELIDARKTEFWAYLVAHEFDVVINCIGVLVKESEISKHKAAFLNSYFPHFLEDFYSNKPTKVIHISTDCIYDDNFYGRSKLVGEIDNGKDLTFRMSLIGPEINPEGTGLFNWFMKQTEKANGYNKVYWNGITTLALSKAIKQVIEENLTGIYNLVPKNYISKFDLLQMFKKVFKKEIEITPDNKMRSNKVLTNKRKEINLLTYRQMLLEMRGWIEKHASLYPHYL